MKPTKSQIEVLELMADGWNLGWSSSFYSRGCWLQKGRIGHGGTCKRLSVNTAEVLCKNEWIRRVGQERFPSTEYTISAAGKRALREGENGRIHLETGTH